MTIHDCMPSQDRLFRPMGQNYIIMGLWACMFVCLLSRFFRISLGSIKLIVPYGTTIYIIISRWIFPSFCLSICLFVCLSQLLYTYANFHLSFFLSVCPSVCLFVFPNTSSISKRLPFVQINNLWYDNMINTLGNIKMSPILNFQHI